MHPPIRCRWSTRRRMRTLSRPSMPTSAIASVRSASRARPARATRDSANAPTERMTTVPTVELLEYQPSAPEPGLSGRASDCRLGPGADMRPCHFRLPRAADTHCESWRPFLAASAARFARRAGRARRVPPTRANRPAPGRAGGLAGAWHELRSRAAGPGEPAKFDAPGRPCAGL